MTTLNEKQQLNIDMLISNNKPKNLSYFRRMSIYFHENLKKVFHEFKEKRGPIYEGINSDNCNSYTSHGLYKSQIGEVYIIEIFIGDLSAYSIIDDELWF